MKTTYYLLFFLLNVSLLLNVSGAFAQTEQSDASSDAAVTRTMVIKILKPSNRAIGVSVSAVIKTESMVGASVYTVELNTSSNFSLPSLVQTSGDSIVKFENLRYLTTYYARAKTDISSAFGPVTYFTTRSPEIYTFVSFPYDGLTNVKVSDLGVTAHLVPGAKRYTIELSTVSDFNDPDGIHFTETSEIDYQRTFVFHNLSYGTTYYARVITDVWPEPGRITSFTTKVEPFSVVVKPINNSMGLDYSYLEITASVVTGAKRYTIELNSKSTFTGQSIVRTSLIDYQRSFIFKDLNPATRYYVRVKPDVYSVYGPVRKFSTREKIKQHRLWGIIAGDGSGAGSVFSYSIDSATSKQHYSHRHPYDFLNGNLVQSGDGGFYFISETAGENNDGSIFKLNANGSVASIEGTFVDQGDIMQASNGDIYLCDFLTHGYVGGILRVNPNRSYDYWGDGFPNYFDSLNGTNPKAAVIELSDGYLFGTTIYEGLNDGGTIFKTKMDGGDFQKIFDFSFSTGAKPSGRLLDGHDGYIYGVTSAGGAFGLGTVYKIAPDGNNYQVLYNFAGGSDGAIPMGELIIANNVLYGTTSSGGDSTRGTIFRLERDGTGYAKLFQFDGENGEAPLGGLVTDGNGILYGITSKGGYTDIDNYVVGAGVVFAINTDGSNFKKLFEMIGSEGEDYKGAYGTLLYLEDDWHPKTSSIRSVTEESLIREEALLENKLNVYPNPFDHTLNIEVTTQVEGVVAVVMYDIRGAIVNSSQGFTNQKIQIDNKSVSGLYILKITTGSDVSIHRVVKK
jgi:uncharacterized repeat protein (TIGR03803 family)